MSISETLSSQIIQLIVFPLILEINFMLRLSVRQMPDPFSSVVKEQGLETSAGDDMK